MKILNIRKLNNFGKEIQFQLLKFENKSFLQLSLSWAYDSTPLYVVISGGSNGFLNITVFLNRFGLEIDLFGKNWEFFFERDVKEVDS